MGTEPLGPGPFDSVWVDVHLATLAGDAPWGAIEHGALGVRDGRIAWLGLASEMPDPGPAATVHRGGGGWLTPGLVDCHTHLIYGGSRAREFELRLGGASYAEIAAAGGGILSTVRATRALGERALVDAARPRLEALLAEGVTTIEIKSGYGLEPDTELRMLRAARALGAEYGVRVRTTLLAAHALPPEYHGRADDYIDLVCREIIPAAAAEGLADAVDVFCEHLAFDLAQTERVFVSARERDLPVKLHAEQLSNMGGSALAARYGALSVDHLEYLDEAGIEAIARSGTVAVLLPGAFYFLRETRLPPVQPLRRHGVPMALATDLNPGTSPLASLLLMMNMGCTLFALTPEEALRGVTANAARALGLQESHGTLAPGKAADLCLWDVEHPAELAYLFGPRRLRAVVREGRCEASEQP